MEADDPRIAGEKLGNKANGKFNYVVLNVDGAALIHVTRSHRPEVVLFGTSHELRLPVVVDAGSRILVNGLKRRSDHGQPLWPQRADAGARRVD